MVGKEQSFGEASGGIETDERVWQSEDTGSQGKRSLGRSQTTGDSSKTDRIFDCFRIPLCINEFSILCHIFIFTIGIRASYAILNPISPLIWGKRKKRNCNFMKM